MSQRLARHYLESLKRAGVTHLPYVSVSENSVDTSDSPAKQVSKPTPVAHREESKPQAAVVRKSPVVETASVPVSVPVVAVAADATSNQRQDALNVLAQQVAACTKCQELAGTRKQTVFGVGNPTADIMFIGEAPGADEDRLGEPFVGKAGQMLNKIIEACQLKREDVYICNILRCRPPGNRNPSPEEAANCREFLDGQIATVQPKYIVCWGSVAAHNLLNVTTSVGRMRGQFYSHGDAKVACTYHPSYLLRNPSAKKQVWEDMKFVFADMGVNL